MRKLYFLFLLIIGFAVKAQTPFWTENFGTNPVCANVLASAYTSTNGAWTTSLTGTNQTVPNVWYVSATEAGMGVGNCGDGCTSNPILINRTLHVSTGVGDLGAAYLAGPGFNSDIRAQSPTINCSGKSGIVLNFNYLMWGVINQDYCQVMYSADNGVTWTGLGIPPQTPTTSCSGQGLWTAHTYNLPASANNNATVKIGFRWQNINATGADPSVAVDDVVLTYTAASSPSLTPSFTLPASICLGDSIQVTANTGTFAISGYTWSTNATGPLMSTPNASVTWAKFLTAGVQTIVLTAQSGTQIASTSNTILVNPTPVVNVSANPSVICSGNSTTLNAGSSTPGLTYSWSPVSSTSQSVVVSPTTTTLYQCVGTNSTTGCKGTGFINITVNPKPTIGISSNTANVCVGSTAVLTATGGASYTWSPGSATGSSVIVSPTVNTTYTVTGTSSLGCTNTNTVSVTVSTCTGLYEQVANELPFSIYPNPAKDRITIKAGDINLNTVKIELFDVTGKKVLEQSFNSLPAGTEQNLQIGHLSKGIFILNMNVNGVQQKSVRLVKE